MATSIDAPKVFISYSWQPISNRQKTISLAERLENEGVNVIIDEWNLAEGQDKYQFMEQMVNDPNVKRVLIICNKEYTEKANSKSGGVGIESLIISDEVYSKVEQTKFIPIIFERNIDGKEYVPTFIKTRIYIDLSNDDTFEDEYEKLMRNLFDKPATKRPPRGNPPAYILETDSVYLRTSNKVKTIQNSLINEKKNSQILIDDYYSTFIDALADFEITQENLTTQYVDDIVQLRIEEMKILRDDFISFFETVCTYSLDLEKLNTFLENLVEFSQKRDSIKYPERLIGPFMNDHYKFFIEEIFLYIATILIQKEKYVELGQILHNDFIIFNQRLNKTEPFTYLVFNQYIESLDKIRNERLQMRRISITADLIKQRADNTKYNFEKLREADVLLYYIGLMRTEFTDPWRWSRWFPKTTVYHIYNLQILEKLISKRHFEKIKPLFEIHTIEELQAKIKNVVENGKDKIQRFDYEFPYLNNAFNFDVICNLK